MSRFSPPRRSTSPAPPPETAADGGDNGTPVAPPIAAAGDGAAPPGLGRFVPRTFDSLRDREFRFFYVAMLGQMAGMNMQMIIRGYLAFVLTDSYAVLGLIGLISAIPMLALSVFGGVIADRRPKRTTLMIGQFIAMTNALIIAALIFTDLIAVHWLMVSAFTHGTMMALTMPSRQAMIPEIVGMDRMMNAVALNMAGMNTMRMLGPALGGFVVAWFGFQWAYLLMAACYGLAVVGLARVAWRPAAAPGREGAKILEVAKSSFSDIGAGLRYIRGDRVMGMLLAVAFVSSIFGMPYMQLLPGYVADVFGGDGGDVGLMISISAIGSLTGALVLATIPPKRRGLLLIFGTMVLGGGLVIFVQTDSYWLGAGFILIVGLGSALRQALSQGLLHAYVENEYRGRVMSVFMLQFSMMQVGTFVVGLIAEVIGIQMALGGLGAALVTFMIVVLIFVPRLRNLD